MRRIGLIVLVSGVAVLAGCTRLASAPPPVAVSTDDGPRQISAWSYCWSGLVQSTCADGERPANPVDVGSPAEVVVDFPLDGWTFQAELVDRAEECGRHRSANIRPDPAAGGTRFVIEPVGPAGTYDVGLFGQGPQGDLSATFRWTTRIDGPPAQPSAQVRVLDDRDGRAVTGGMELFVSNLATSTGTTPATVTVVAADGTEVVFEAVAVPEPCLPGSRSWYAAEPERQGVVPPDGHPFAYEVELELDGVAHVAKAAWPNPDADDGGFVPLDFEPPLPAENLADPAPQHPAKGRYRGRFARFRCRGSAVDISVGRGSTPHSEGEEIGCSPTAASLITRCDL